MTRKTATRRTFIKGTTAAAGATTLGFPYIAKGATIELKIGSLAPKRSTWANVLTELAREVSELTAGGLQLLFFWGGTQGDEKEMVRKVRTRQLDGCAVTTVGLGAIDPQILMFQLPMLFAEYGKLDKVRDKMFPKFAGRMEKDGFVMTGRGDVGWVYLFSNDKVEAPGDITKVKPWQWDTDPVGGEIMKAAGANGVPLGVADVLPALSTGMIDAFTNSPYGAIALQWFTKVQYVLNLKLAMAIGASVMSQESLAALPDDMREILRKATEENSAKLIRRIRYQNKKAVETLVDKGIEVVEPTDFVGWANLAVKVRNALVGKVFEEELLNELLDHIKNA